MPLVAPGWEDMLIRTMMASSDRLLVQQILQGDGQGANLRGIVGATGVLTATYAAADKGGPDSFHDAEDMLAIDVPTDRRSWILSEDLYRKARRTLRDPGSGDFVLRGGRVLEDAPGIRTNVLPAGTGVYGEFSALTLGVWGEVNMVIDRVTVPGLVKLTMLRHVDSIITRPARFAVLSAA